MLSSLQRYCTNCGAANQPQAAFCFACGQSLQALMADTTPLNSAAAGSLAPNHLLKERYRIVAQIGKGGMGTVYKAEDTLFDDSPVAVKELSQSGLAPQEAIEATDAFKREARLLVGLNHPNLPRIHDYFADAGRWYLVMDFIEGETLESYLNKAHSGYLPVSEALDIGIELCTVLDYLHTHQPPIIFRDLKPGNVIRRPDGRLYLIDFGIARHFKPGQVHDTVALGSVGYAAPEQYGKAQTSPRSDIYSLGALLHQLFSGDDPSEAPFQFAPLNGHGRPVPAGLETLVMQMLARDASKRPASMAAVKQELQRIAAHVPAKQGVSWPGALPQKNVQKRFSQLTTTRFMVSLVLILLIVSSSIGIFSLVRVNQVATNKAHATSTALRNAVTPTINATAIASYLQNTYDNTIVGTPLLVDPLHDNSGEYGWTESNSPSGSSCAFAGGAYHASQSDTNSFIVCAAVYSQFSHFVFEVQMKIIKGDAGGIIFRADIFHNSYYVFVIGQDGTYQLFVCKLNTCNSPLTSGISSAIKQGLNQTNFIAALATGSSIGLYVNHQFVDAVDDSTLDAGQIGVCAFPLPVNGHPTEVVYSNAKAWTV